MISNGSVNLACHKSVSKEADEYLRQLFLLLALSLPIEHTRLSCYSSLSASVQHQRRG